MARTSPLRLGDRLRCLKTRQSALLALCGLLLAPAGSAQTLSLQAAIQDALASQGQVRAAEHLRKADADLLQASRAAVLPQLSLNTASIWSQSRNQQPLFVSANGPREVIGQFAVSVPLYAPQLWALRKLARGQVDVATATEQNARLRVAARVLNAWYQLALAQKRLAIWQSTFADTDTLLADTQKAYRAGAASRLDVLQTESLLTQARSGLQDAQAEADAASRFLNLQVGLAPSTPLHLPLPHSLQSPLPKRATLEAQADRNQPVLHLAAQQIEVGKARVGVQRSSLLPSLQGSVAYGVDTVTVPESRDLGWQAALRLHWQLFGFGQRREQIAAAQQQLAALKATRQALRLQIYSAIATDYGLAQVARRDQANARISLAQAHGIYVMTRKGFFAGAMNALNLAQAQSTWVKARLALASAQIRSAMTQDQLELDTGQYPGEGNPPT
ncbi:TolC family protein [Acidithiobacillus sp. AMEEHan]|uniref:TolC family protein n=1 Tax=Acidithiobacillus sp. AMEEHan TaxID=2994951 RepID=UPI0027E5B3EB|nr:TolC family protein [Acidithiobacillus sp. AMEEHan]